MACHIRKGSRNSDLHAARRFICNAYMIAAGENPVAARCGSGRQCEFSRPEEKRSIAMTGLKTLVAAALISAIPATSVLAQEPAAFQATYPNRDVLNGGALTPAGRLGLEPAFGAAAPNAAALDANAGTGSAGPSLRTRRHRSDRHVARP
jgi:hypothetical protein